MKDIKFRRLNVQAKYERIIKPIGNTCHVTIPREHLGKKAIILITNQ